MQIDGFTSNFFLLGESDIIRKDKIFEILESYRPWSMLSCVEKETWFVREKGDSEIRIILKYGVLHESSF